MIKVLVVDDEPGVCEVVQKTFTYVGFSVLMATDSTKALAIFKKERPRIIFLDIVMEVVDGFQLLTEIKKIDPRAVVIMVTALKDPATREKALQLGADEVVTKPFSHNYLRSVAVQKIGDVLDKGGHMEKPRLLIVDDEKDARQFLKDFINQKFECDLSEASDGKEAIEKVKKDHYDIVLLDIKMPGMSGIDVLKEIKTVSPDSRVMIISAWKSADVVNQAVKTGANDYIGKPVSSSVLLEKLKNSLLSIGKLIPKKF